MHVCISSFSRHKSCFVLGSTITQVSIRDRAIALVWGGMGDKNVRNTTITCFNLGFKVFRYRYFIQIQVAFQNLVLRSSDFDIFSKSDFQSKFGQQSRIMLPLRGVTDGLALIIYPRFRVPLPKRRTMLSLDMLAFLASIQELTGRRNRLVAMLLS